MLALLLPGSCWIRRKSASLRRTSPEYGASPARQVETGPREATNRSRDAMAGNSRLCERLRKGDALRFFEELSRPDWMVTAEQEWRRPARDDSVGRPGREKSKA
jgi:hypothetical protein